MCKNMQIVRLLTLYKNIPSQSKFAQKLSKLQAIEVGAMENEQV